MNIVLNGEKKNVPDSVTVLGLLELLQIQHQRVAVELNENIVRKDRYASTAIQEGDALEVVSFMGGGQQMQSVDCGIKKYMKKEYRYYERRQVCYCRY